MPGMISHQASPATVQRGNFDIILALFCAFLLISNVGATKLIAFGPIVTDGGAFLFPLTYIFGDILAEVYGLARARRAIFTGFVVSITASIVFLIVDSAPPAPEWPNQDAWHAVLGFVPRIVLASLAAYLVGQLLNAWVLVKLKEHLPASGLWGRLVGSTIVGELADTIIFCMVAWAGLISAGMMVNYILVGYAYKVIVEIVLLPVTYRVIAFVKSREPQ